MNKEDGSVNQLKPETMKVADLNYWLSQHKLSQKGKKVDLMERYVTLIEYHCKSNCSLVKDHLLSSVDKVGTDVTPPISSSHTTVTTSTTPWTDVKDDPLKMCSFPWRS